MVTWDERFQAGDYPVDADPSRVLTAYSDALPDGRALDIATGPGRNAVFLANHGYTVDALDQSRVGLTMTRRKANEAGGAVNCIQGDATEFHYPPSTYDVITISYYRILDRLADVKAALAPGGILFYEHHLRSSEDALVGPSTDRYRFAANELLRACLDLTILYYDEGTEPVGGGTAATASIIARNSTGSHQTYPPRPLAQHRP